MNMQHRYQLSNSQNIILQSGNKSQNQFSFMLKKSDSFESNPKMKPRPFDKTANFKEYSDKQGMQLLVQPANKSSNQIMNDSK
mmetsp:Transcript_18187/g.27984  ORF Transcript_18187/g.27984 Transcript_18187/m.27984 type:complete len:83 (-) Transcript_18187:933-1181(-)